MGNHYILHKNKSNLKDISKGYKKYQVKKLETVKQHLLFKRYKKCIKFGINQIHIKLKKKIIN